MQDLSDIGYYMTSPDINLRKVGEPEYNSLPKGVQAIVMNGDVIFVRRVMGRFMPVPSNEQEQLKKKHVIDD